MGMVEPLAFGMAAMAASTFCDSCAGSAPMRLMMADRLFSDASSMALSKWMGSMVLDCASPATPIEAWKAS